MEKQSGRRKWVISAAAIAVIVPVSLVMLSLNGFFSQSPTPEGITAETVTWEIERPYHTVDILDFIENSNTNNEASVGLGVSINKYIENFQDYGGADFINMNVSVAAEVGNGFVKNVNITFYNDTQPSQVRWANWYRLNGRLHYTGQFENLSVADYSQYRESEQYMKASTNLEGVNKPSAVHFNAPVHWILRTANAKSHHLTVATEITYYNGTAYKRVVLPIVLRVIADAGDSFETARNISFGNHTAFIHWGDDPEDYYRIWLDQNQVISMQLSMPEPSAGLYLDLYLYSPDGNLVANSTSRKPDSIEQITYTINQSGNWYVRVLDPYAGYTLYTLSIKAEQP